MIIDQTTKGDNMIAALLAGLEGQARGGGGEEEGQQAEEATHLLVVLK
jgi:hypothetical protein